jgi:hypothetical protein
MFFSWSKGSLILEPNEFVQIVPHVSGTAPFVVPLTPSVLDNSVTFVPSTNSFQVQQSGTYLAEFFLKAEENLSEEMVAPFDPRGYLVIALRNVATGALLAVTKLIPNNVAIQNYTVSASGTHQALLRLNQGDALQLVVVGLPATNPSPPGVPSEIEFDMDGGDSGQISSDEVAYLSLLKVG